MAIKPISYYGQFTPTGVDQSGAKRMQALAGLAEQVGGMAEQFGIDKAEKETPAVAAQALQESITVDESGQKVYEEIPTFKGWDAERRNALAIAGYTASLENDVTNIVDSAKLNNPTNTTEYSNVVTAAMKGLKTNLPENAKGLVESYFNQINRTAFQGIQKEEIQINNDIALGNIETYVTNANVNIVNLAREGRNAELIEAILNRDVYAQESIKAGILDASNYRKEMEELNVQIVEQSALGTYNFLLQDESKTPQVRVAESEEALKTLKAQDRVSIPNPINPEENITLSPDQKENLEKDLKTNIKDFKDSAILEAQKQLQADEFDQIANYSQAQKAVEDTSISPKEQLQNISQLEKDGQIKKDQARILKAYVNSVEKLNAAVNANSFGDIITKIHDLNALVTYDEDNSNDYLRGINNITDEILKLRTSGNMSRPDELKLKKQITNLTAAKVAGATQEVFEYFTEASDAINMGLPPEFQGMAKRDLFYAVDAEVQKAEATGIVLPNSEIKLLYSNKANVIIDNINTQRRSSALKTVNSITQSVVIPSKPTKYPNAVWDSQNKYYYVTNVNGQKYKVN
tara:strand:- start:4169 stop:5899 length:1731 start_codon:yes stop_codon:yes gene_type:complete